MSLTLTQLQSIMPLAKDRARLFLEPLDAAMTEFGIDTPLRQAAFLAQICHESGHLLYVEELASGAAYDNRADLGNTEIEAVRIAKKYGSTAGRFFKGYGLIQLTGYYNIRAYSEATGDDYVNTPSKLKEPIVAAHSAAWFWNSRKLNALADTGDFRAITKRINGGYNGWDDRLAAYNRAKKVLGVGA